MAKAAMVEREKKRQKLVEKYAAKRAALKEIANGRIQVDGRAVQGAPQAGEAAAQFLGARPVCTTAARSRAVRKAYYRKLKMSRIALRDLASFGQIPGMVKSSW